MAPSPAVLAYLRSAAVCRISVITVHELHYGIGLLPPGRRRDDLFARVEELVTGFANSILPIGPIEARIAADLRASARSNGRQLHLADALIAATAAHHGMTLATRNTSDFLGLGLTLVDPWVAN